MENSRRMNANEVAKVLRSIGEDDMITMVYRPKDSGQAEPVYKQLMLSQDVIDYDKKRIDTFIVYFDKQGRLVSQEELQVDFDEIQSIIIDKGPEYLG